MSTITRRQVATGAAWAVPVIAVGAAAPAMAASGCPTFTVLSATAVKGGVRLTLGFASTFNGYCFTSITSTGLKTLTWQIPSCLSGGQVLLVATGTNTGNDFGGTYTLNYQLTSGVDVVCTGALSFTAV